MAGDIIACVGAVLLSLLFQRSPRFSLSGSCICRLILMHCLRGFVSVWSPTRQTDMRRISWQVAPSISENSSHSRASYRSIPVVRLNSILVAVPVILDNLNPVSVGVQQESHVAHPAIREPLLPVALEVLEPLAGSVQVIDRDAYNIKVSMD